MYDFEKYKLTDEIIAKFKNGNERYMKSALFNQVVQSLVRGANEYEIIDQLINVVEDTQLALIQHMHRSTPSINLSSIRGD